MKKLFLSLAMALISVGASAQTTWNVRGLFGMASDDLGDPVLGVGGLFQANVSFKRGGNWIFSPTAFGTYDFNDGGGSFVFAPCLGYKTKVSDNLIFSPKVGPAVGYNGNAGGCTIAGIAGDLSFEVKHFVVGATGYYSFISTDCEESGMMYDDINVFNYGVYLTLGYKF